MTSKLNITRRTFVGAAAATVLMRPAILRAASEEIVMANFGGGTAQAFNESYLKPFTAETGIATRVVEVPSTETALISGAASQEFNSSYHSYSGAIRLCKMGIVEPLAIADYPVLQQIPEEYWPKIDGKHVAGMPIQFLAYSIAFNKDAAKAEDFKSWKALSDEKFRQQVTFTRPVFASLYDVPWYSKMIGGDQKHLDAGVAQYKAVAANSLTAYNSMAQNNQLLQRGDAIASAYYSSRVWLMRNEGIENLDMVIPDEGALMIPYVFVLPKNCPHPEAARKFLAYAGTAAPAERSLQVTGALPLNLEAKVDDALVKDRMGHSLEDVKKQLFNPDWSYIEETRQDLIKRLEAEVASAQ